jgi:N6-adenosine-specific RNA methylase IME4
MTFSTILADPPWPYNNVDGPRAAPEHRPNSWNGVTGAAGSALRYGSMSIEKICNLPVKKIVEKNAHLYLWVTNSFLVEAHTVAKAWGFKPKTLLTWVKVKYDGTPSMKTGFYYRSATEHILFCVRGSLRLNGPCRPTAYFHPRRRHSQKPDFFYELIEEQSPPEYLELFARKTRPGWASWGNEIQSSIDIQSNSSKIGP